MPQPCLKTLMLTSTTPITMPNSELATGVTSLSDPIAPAFAQAENEATHLNPLFQPETLEQLTQALFQEIERHDLTEAFTKFLPLIPSVQPSDPTLAAGFAPTAIPSVPTPPVELSRAAIPGNQAPSFYFLEAASQTNSVLSVAETSRQFPIRLPLIPSSHLLS